MTARRAFITGITGQDGAYLAKSLLAKGYEVWGLLARRSSDSLWRLRELAVDRDVRLLDGDLHRRDVAAAGTAAGEARRGLQPRGAELRRDLVAPAAPHRQRHRRWARCTCSRRSACTIRRSASTRPRPARCSAWSAAERQDERTPFHPRSPYGVAKLFAHWIDGQLSRELRDARLSGILFNHESPLRGSEFVTRKVTHAVGAHQARARAGAAARQPRREARLGIRRRLRGGDVADAAAGRAGRLRGGHRAAHATVREICSLAFGRLGLDYARSRRRRSRADAPRRGRRAARRSRQGAREARLVPRRPRSTSWSR